MARPSRLARKVRRAHERRQVDLRKQKSNVCECCDICPVTEVREIEKAIGESLVPPSQPQAHQRSRRSELRQFLKRNRFEADILVTLGHVQHARLASDLESRADQGRSVYWTDASRLGTEDYGCGIGVTYRFSTEKWAELSWSVRASIDVFVLEIYAIAKALEIARERCRNVEAEHRPGSVCVYSDCEDALRYFLQFERSLSRLGEIPYGGELVGPGLQAAEELCVLKITVELRFVPGHAGIVGNVKADRAAKRGAKHSVGPRKAGRLITQCGGREMLGSPEAQVFTPIPWRTHPQPDA